MSTTISQITGFITATKGGDGVNGNLGNSTSGAGGSNNSFAGGAGTPFYGAGGSTNGTSATSSIGAPGGLGYFWSVDNNTYGGGAGGLSSTSPPGIGGTGVVVIYYAGTPVSTGGTITQAGGSTYHRFTANGTFTA